MAKGSGQNCIIIIISSSSSSSSSTIMAIQHFVGP
jgi:hypothetical protein